MPKLTLKDQIKTLQARNEMLENRFADMLDKIDALESELDHNKGLVSRRDNKIVEIENNNLRLTHKLHASDGTIKGMAQTLRIVCGRDELLRKGGK